MTDAATIAADPAWLPHRIDLPARKVEFLHVPRGELADRGFLADRSAGPRGTATLSFDAVAAAAPKRAQTAHFLFHSAFCRSTLLVRALDRQGAVAGLNEPNIIAALSGGGEAVRPLLAPLLAMLSRPSEEGEIVVMKPTNMANRLIPALMKECGEARAILMTNSLEGFLGSVARRGLLGRRWGRQLFLDLQGYAGMDFGMPPADVFALTDLQAAGLAWFLSQRYFGALSQGQVAGLGGERFRILDGDRFPERREDTLAASLEFFGVSDARELAGSLSTGDVFDHHAKLGGDAPIDSAPSTDEKLAEEIAQVGEWLAMIAGQAGVALPAPHDLFT